MPEHIHCPVMSVMRQQEIMYMSCKLCYGKLGSPAREKGLEQHKYNKQDAKNYKHKGSARIYVDKGLFACTRCCVAYEASDILHRYRLCIVIPVNNYLQKVTIFGDSFDSIFGCSATKFQEFKEQLLLDLDPRELNFLIFSALEWILAGEIYTFTFSQEQWHLFKKSQVQSNSDKNSTSIVASRMQSIMKPCLTVIEYIRNYNCNYEKKWEIFYKESQKIDERLFERLDNELKEVIVDNTYGLTHEELYNEGSKGLSNTKFIHEFDHDVSDILFVELSDHFDLDLFHSQTYFQDSGVLTEFYSQDWSDQENLDDMLNWDPPENCNFPHDNVIRVSFNSTPSSLSPHSFNVYNSPFDKSSNHSFDKHGDIVTENSFDD
ncbi:702_t:CDS:2 [Dentiscutata erythropus]|uniref:702_t:CDS:1 n=1 Tax=Dentiscutata erythropus TaxID=1348616 RepID=A0A9N9HZ70_9GLOM|nr:702_t:CDS:2 [Dentiscutata erythropus]